MSGGHFDYRDFYIQNIADQIERVIEENDDPSEYGDGYVKWGFSERTLDRFREAIDCLKRAAVMVHRIDWLLSGDDDEESFHERWGEEVR